MGNKGLIEEKQNKDNFDVLPPDANDPKLLGLNDELEKVTIRFLQDCILSILRPSNSEKEKLDLFRELCISLAKEHGAEAFFKDFIGVDNLKKRIEERLLEERSGNDGDLQINAQDNDDSGNNALLDSQIKEELKNLIRDITFLYRCIIKLLDEKYNESFYNEIYGKEKEILERIRILDEWSGILEGLTQASSEEKEIKISEIKNGLKEIFHFDFGNDKIEATKEKKEVKEKKEDKEDNNKETDELSEEGTPAEATQGEEYDVNYFISIVNNYLEKERNNSACFIRDIGSETAFKKKISKIKTDLGEKINTPRIIDAHNKKEKYENGFSKFVTDRATKLKESIFEWYGLFKYKKKGDILDRVNKDAQKIECKLINGTDDKKIIVIAGRRCEDCDSLVTAMAENWGVGVEYLKADTSVRGLIKDVREDLLPTYDIISHIVKEVIKRETQRRIEEITAANERIHKMENFDFSVYDDYKLWYDVCLFKFVYSIYPKYENFCWQSINVKPEDFAKNWILSILNQRNFLSALKMLLISRLNTLALYGLLSFYFEKKEIDGDIPFKKIEMTIINFCRVIITDKGRYFSLVSLYELFEALIQLMRGFGVEYRYHFVICDETYFTRESITERLLSMLREKKIKDVYNAICSNAFASFRAWLNMENTSRRTENDTFYYWYLASKSLTYSVASDSDYSKLVERYHKKGYPTCEIERHCLTVIKFIGMIADKDDPEEYKRILEECNNILINYYYDETQKSNYVCLINNEDKTEVEDVISSNSVNSYLDEFEKSADTAKADQLAVVWCKIAEFALSKELMKGSSDDKLKKYENAFYNIGLIRKQSIRKEYDLLYSFYDKINEQVQERIEGLFNKATEDHDQLEYEIWGPTHSIQYIKNVLASTYSISKLRVIKSNIEATKSYYMDFVNVKREYLNCSNKETVELEAEAMINIDEYATLFQKAKKKIYKMFAVNIGAAATGIAALSAILINLLK